MGRFQNKYRTPSARAPFWDYGWNAAYFVTICTHGRVNYFGHVRDGEMILSEIGEIAHNCWIDIPNHFPFVKLDAFIVMPNHVHGIIIIDKPDDERNDGHDDGRDDESHSPSPSPPSPPKNRFGPQSKNLASIVRGFKIGITKNARQNDSNFKWQPRFYDHIIRNNIEYQRIRKYIINNPLKWKEDKFHPSNNKIEK